MKEFEFYIKAIESYKGKTPIYAGLVKAKLYKMEFKYADNPTKEEM